MTTLINKTSRYYILFSLIVFAAGSIIFFFMLKSILDQEVTENLRLEKIRVEKEIRESKDFSALGLFYGYRLAIQPTENNPDFLPVIKDTLLFDELEKEELPFREIRFPVAHEGRHYVVTLRTSLVEEHDLKEGVLMAMAILFVLFLLSLFFINRWVNKRLWNPFYQALTTLKAFDVNRAEKLSFEPTSIREFSELNQALTLMSDRVLSDYRSMKEFTENASHEIQTPLSIITNKLENLIQSDSFSAEQFAAIQTVYESAIRLSRLNNSLVLLTRIDNNQFKQTDHLFLSGIIDKYLLLYEELIHSKGIRVHRHCIAEKPVHMNPSLAETLISNLLMNAIKHNITGGEIGIKLSGSELIIHNTGSPVSHDPNEFFKRFKKADPASDSLGLGLAIIKGIAEHSGFTITYVFAENRHIVSLSF